MTRACRWWEHRRPREWAVYDCVCLRCQSRYISAAPVRAEAQDLWECPHCGAMALAHTRHPDDVED